MGIQYPDWTKTHGSSAFTPANDDLRPFFQPHNPIPAIPLGINTPGGNVGATWNTQELQGQMLLFAPNGVGKTAGIVIPTYLAYPGNIAGNDIKGECCFTTAERRVAMGQRVVRLDPFHGVERRYGFSPVPATRFNPLSALDPRSKEFVEDIDAIEDATIVDFPGSDPHWPESGRDFFGGGIALAKERYGTKATFRHVREFMVMGPGEITAEIAKAKTQYPNSVAARKLARWTGDTDEVQSVRSTALTQTKFLLNDELLDGMTNDDPIFNLDDFTTQPMTIYIVLPVDKLTSYGRWMRMIQALLLRAIVRGKTPKIPHVLMVEEMGNLGPMHAIEKAYGLFRSYGVRMIGVYQSLGQMKRDYPHSWGNLINNCSVLQLLGVRDHETAQYFSDLLGTETVRDPTLPAFSILEFMAAENPILYNERRTRTAMERPAMARPLMYPHELGALLGADPTMTDNTQLIIYPQGGRRVLALQNPYFNERRWQGWWRPENSKPAQPRANDNERSYGGGALPGSLLSAAIGEMGRRHGR